MIDSAATTGSPTDDARLADELEHLAAQLPPSSSKDACMEAAKIVTGMPTDDAVALEAVADAIDEARYAHPDHPRERPRPFSEADWSDREYALRLARAALRRTAPVAGRDRGVRKAVESAIRNLVSSRDDLGYTHFLEIRDAVFAALSQPAETPELGSSEPLGPRYDGTTMDNQQLHGTTRRNQPVVTAGETATGAETPAAIADVREAERLISTMALAMQTAQGALQNVDRNEPLEAAFSSLTIALQMEADHWQTTQGGEGER